MFIKIIGKNLWLSQERRVNRKALHGGCD